MGNEIYGPPDVGGEPTTLERTVRYIYDARGHASNISVKDAGDPLTRDLAMYYDGAGRLTLALWSEWFEPVPGFVLDYTPVKAKEFRYDANGRERYYSRELDPNALLDTPPEVLPLTALSSWTDYEGTAPVADAVMDDATQSLSLARRYFDDGSEEGFDEITGASEGRRWRHSDLIGSTTLETDAQGEPVARRAYSAFGESLGSVGAEPDIESRYGYAGDWGYEEGLLTLEGAIGTEPIVLTHLGERWYQPGIGRFVQRDPAGLRGGLNSYIYVYGLPTSLIDPSGMSGEGRGTAAGAATGFIVGGAIIATGVIAAPAVVVLGATVLAFTAFGVYVDLTSDDPRSATLKVVGAGVGMCLGLWVGPPFGIVGLVGTTLLDDALQHPSIPEDVRDFGGGFFPGLGVGGGVKSLPRRYGN